MGRDLRRGLTESPEVPIHPAMRFLRWSRRSGRPLIAAALLLAFLGGWAGGALHLSGASGPSPPTPVLSESGQGAPVGHSEQDCRLCNSAQSTVLVPSHVVPWDAGRPDPVPGFGFDPLLTRQVFAGTPGSRAPPAIPL